MCSIHCTVFWFNCNMFAFNWASNCIAKLNEPCIFLTLVDLELGNKDTVVTTGFYMNETLHILNRSLVLSGIPESDTHIISFWLSVSEDNGLIQVGPHVLRLNVGEKDI